MRGIYGFGLREGRRRRERVWDARETLSRYREGQSGCSLSSSSASREKKT